MENTKKKGWPVWATIVVILLWLVGLTLWVQYERTRWEEMQREQVVAKAKPILHISQKAKADALCDCPEPKARVSSNRKPKPKSKSAPMVASKPQFKVDELLSGLRTTPKVAVTTEVASAKPAEDDFYDKAVMPRTWELEPEEEVAPEPPPKVGRKILVIRQQPVMPYYGGYSSGYYPYAPQVTYGTQYVPPPQTVFIPAPPVIVHAPSVVVPAPSVVTPAGEYKPQGSTGGHSPSGTTGTAL